MKLENGDAEGFKDDFGQVVLGQVKEWRRGKETGVYWTLWPNTCITMKTYVLKLFLSLFVLSS